jgi:hypothetical protein
MPTPGGNVSGPTTSVFAGTSFDTKTDAKVTLPTFVIVPRNVSKPPGGTGLTGQDFVSFSLGLQKNSALHLLVSVTVRANSSVPRATTVFVVGLLVAV